MGLIPIFAQLFTRNCARNIDLTQGDMAYCPLAYSEDWGFWATGYIAITSHTNECT